MTKLRVRLTDVSLTTGQGNVWAGAMTSPMIGAVVRQLAAAQPDVMEICSALTLRQCVDRGEDPWQRIDIIRERCPQMALRAVVSLLTEHGWRGVDVLAPEVAAQWLRELAQRGVGEVLLVDPLLNLRRIAPLVKLARSLGMTPTAALPFFDDAALTNQALCAQALALAGCGVTRVMLRDESAVLTPDRLASLLPALRQALGTTPLDLHLGCQTALAPLVGLEALRLGVQGLDTAFAPLANGPSVPAMGTLVKSARLLDLGGAVEGLSLPAVEAAGRALAELAQRHGFAQARPWAFTLAPYMHQLPGDVAADFMARLETQGLGSRLNAFAGECARIRVELGRPPMAAPFARPIAQQAWLHLQGLPRYAEIRPGVRRIIQQCYGSASGRVDGALARRIGRPPKAPAPPLRPLSVSGAEVPRSAWVLAQVCGVEPRSLPAPLSHVPYESTTPAQALIAGLSARAARFAQLNAFAPGLAVRLQGGKGERHV